MAGALFVVSSANSDGTDLRPGRYTSLASLVRGESEQTQVLQDRANALSGEVDELTRSVQDERVSGYRREIDRLDGPAQVSAVRGEGVTVTLADAPDDVIDTTTEDLNLLLVHQQDIQAVVNAMWAGGAEAVTIAGQRVVSTTGIKCVGNAVQLGGIPYSQPYVIAAVGDQDTLTDAISSDDYLINYRAYSESPDFQIGWDFELDGEIEAPAYDGLLDLSYAAPLGAG